MVSPEFLVTSLIVALAPGTGVIYTLISGLSGGARAGFFAAVGCTLGILPHLLATILGVAAVLHASAVAFEILKWIGVGVLLFLAWGIWRDKGSLSLDGSVSGARPLLRPRAIIGRGFAMNIVNPKLSVFFLAFLPQFVEASAPGAARSMAVLGLVFMGITFVVFVGYGAFAGRVRLALARRPRVMDVLRKSVAGVFVLFGLRLALSER